MYTGGNTDQLRPMTKVESHPYFELQTFISKDIFQLCIGEEANLQGNMTKSNRSDNSAIIVVGVDFYVHAMFSDVVGWMVQTSVCQDGDDVLKIPPNGCVDPSNQQ